MKKIFLALAFLSTVLVSCEKEITEELCNESCYRVARKEGKYVLHPVTHFQMFEGTLYFKNVCNGEVYTETTNDTALYNYFILTKEYCGYI